MPKFQDDPVISRTQNAPDGANFGIYGESSLFNGVRGVTYAPGHGAVVGISENHTAQAGPGIFGQSDGTGVWGVSKTWMGVYGSTQSTTGGAGVMGEGNPGPGVIGKSSQWVGVYGETAGIVNGPAGVWGEHKGAGIGVKAVSQGGMALAAYSNGHEAIHAETQSPGTAAVAAYNLNPNGTGAAVYGKKAGAAGHAGFFDGRVFISGDLGVGGDIQLANADIAEKFDVLCDVPPGSVVCLSAGGEVVACAKEYDEAVVGVISGAGTYRPGLLLDSERGSGCLPVALVGKVYCKVDATSFPVAVGDLLTTSSTPGHAMKATDRSRCFGSLVGKALAPLENGCSMIPVLVTLA